MPTQRKLTNTNPRNFFIPSEFHTNWNSLAKVRCTIVEDVNEEGNAPNNDATSDVAHLYDQIAISL